MPATKENVVEYFSVNGNITLKGFIKNGLDTSTIINLIIVFDSNFSEFEERGFTFPPNLFFYHEISWPEVIGVLVNQHKFTKEEAIEAMKLCIMKFNLQKIKRNELIDAPFEKIVDDANARIVQRCNNSQLKIGEQDVIIISGFLRNKINVVHSGDKGFLKTREELGINVIPLPKRDIEKENKIKEWMKKRYG